MSALKDGDRVRQTQSGATGTVAGDPRPMRSAGDAMFVRVIWDHPFKLDRGSMEAVRRLEVIR